MIADGEIVAFHDVTSFSPAGADAELEAHRTADRGRAGGLLPVRPDVVRRLRPFGLAAARAEVGPAPRDLFGDQIRFSEHLDEEGEVAFRAACEKGWEGLIAVLAPTRTGARRTGRSSSA